MMSDCAAKAKADASQKSEGWSELQQRRAKASQERERASMAGRTFTFAP